MMADVKMCISRDLAEFSWQAQSQGPFQNLSIHTAWGLSPQLTRNEANPIYNNGRGS